MGLKTQILAVVGALATAKCVGTLAKVFLDCKVRRGKPVISYAKAPGSYAVVTGPTSGIGEEFAVQLASAGLNVLLVGRSPERLDAVAARVTKETSSTAKIYVLDFLTAGEAEYSAFEKALSELPVSVLVNNAGMIHDIAHFEDLSVEAWSNVLKVNVNAPMRVAKAVIPELKKNGKGLIWNVGSFSSIQPMPFAGPYAESKAAIGSFSISLAQEIKPDGIDVVLLQPYYVYTKLAGIPEVTYFRPLPRDYVKAQIGGIGLAGGAYPQAYTSEIFWPHAFMQWAVRHVLPSYFFLNAVDGMLRRKAESIRLK